MTLFLHLEGLFATLAQLFNGAVEVEHNVVFGSVQNLTDRAGDAVGVMMGVFNSSKLGGDLVGNAVRKGVRNLLQYIVSSCHS